MIRCGFFNSVNNDRVYDAEDMGKIFEGIISDGVFNNINSGNSFKVTKNNNTMTVNIAAGKAWFYNKYFEIVGTEPVTLRNGDVNPRWDAICIKLDNSSSVREGSLYVYEGEPNAEPVKPTITSTDDIKLIPITYIKIPANAVNVNNAVITSTIGTRLCPYSETTLDPRRAMYIYEGESGESEPLTGFNVKNFYVQAVTAEPVTSDNIQVFWVTIPLTELGYEGSETIDTDFIKNNIPLIRTTSGFVRENNSVPSVGYTVEGADSSQHDYLLLSPKSYGFNKPYSSSPNGLHIKVGYWRQNNSRPINIAEFSFHITILYREEL